MASEAALTENGKELNIEGESVWIPEGPPVAKIVERLASGVRAGFGYLGARNIAELQAKAQFVRITENGAREGFRR